MFYETYKRLCEENGDTTTGVSTKVGFSKGSVSYWKKQYEKGIEATPDTKVAQLIADYFGVSVDYLLGRTDDPGDRMTEEKTPTVEGGRRLSDDEIKIALWGTRDVDDDVLEQVRTFAHFARENRKDK